MIETDITNSHLKNIIFDINDYLINGEEVPDILFNGFIKELNMSSLLIPGIIEDESLNFDILISDDENARVLPLFTDSEEFVGYYGEGSESYPVPNHIEFYIELVKENHFDGLIINPGSNEFYLEADLLFEIPLYSDFGIDEDFEGFPAEELLDISKKVQNDSLLEFIRSEEDYFEGLMLELSKSSLLNLVVSERDLSGYAEDGIISVSDVGEFNLCITGDEHSQFGVLFTGVDVISQTIDKDAGLYYYYQLTLLDDFIKFILQSDMDGIILNPGLDDYMITREELLEAYGGLTFSDPNFKNAVDYAFLF